MSENPTHLFFCGFLVRLIAAHKVYENVRRMSSFSAFHIRRCGLFPIRINLKLWMLEENSWWDSLDG
jgi:hypothetical protein